MNRTANVSRLTAETKIELELSLEGKGIIRIDTGIGFLDHMLTLFAAHGHFDLRMDCSGDLHVDGHHTAEDAGIALGQAFDKALGERRGITRYGSAVIPMDEALVMTALDISGRPLLAYGLTPACESVGGFDSELIEEFFLGFVRNCGLTLHIKQMAGKNTHHIFEAAFKSFGRAMAQAVAQDPSRAGEIPSTKGTLI